MRKGILTSFEEPTDEELSELMHEVALEVQRNETIIQKELAERIAREIQAAQERFKAKQL